jgi:diguanylate cyclase (GGDEF)-like protein
MLKVYNCIVTEHDLRLVVLAAAVCGLASFSAINLVRHARNADPLMRGVWLAVAAISTGFGIWATHFIAMLAFSPNIQSGYNVTLTILSLLAAMGLTAVGFAVAIRPSQQSAWLGGAIVGGGIAAMHYLGMAAFEVAGTLQWDPVMVAASIVLGGAIAAAALPVGLLGAELKWRVAGSVLLTLAICSHHFTAMAAVLIVPDSTVAMTADAIPAGLLAISIAFAGLVILALALAAVAVDIRNQRQERENDRMRGLANATVEGLMICDGVTVVTVNNSLAALARCSVGAMMNTPVARWLPEATRIGLFAEAQRPLETELHTAEGATCAVELIVRVVDFGGRPHHAIAVCDLTARNEAEQHIHFLAHHDALTSVANRSFFNERLDQELAAAAQRGQQVAVLCLDLDRFKQINDFYGHAAGDKVLKTVAKRIKSVLTGGQMVARLGGDEFAIMMPALESPAAAGALAERVLSLLAAQDESADMDAINTSIGIAIYPQNASDRHTLLSHADTALYRAKAEGRNTWRSFEATMGAEARDRRLLEHDLRHAVARDELHVVYQPQIDIKTGAAVGMEALLRWRHPVRGQVSPGLFIPVAEETGSILQIGEWVLRTACQEAATWTQPLTIAVNVSPVQIYNENFVRFVHMTLLETGLAASRLELEITETALIRDLERALNTLRRIKALGVRVAMDDFGTGYSSLSNLRAFPFDKIKIDGSFIKSVEHNTQAATIVRAVLGLGRGLGLPVLAEGVETSAELTFLQNEQCDEVQGYLLGRPGDIAQFRGLTHDDGQTDAIAAEAMRSARVA